ncbi:hypothetical protein PT285_07715 [Lactobacillus sp. ESL0791]|uniref:hypothetical protein n=1 Tax=Lactobacillus sp. ESL0791 TaxID=2983234 RepID=UPI0023F92754|nr:hypothetical protein [Lactobacillus sp. ESL0791]MDF7639286.1 hypothetical protein [Lactobacillus sp. ESL0791]
MNENLKLFKGGKLEITQDKNLFNENIKKFDKLKNKVTCETSVDELKNEVEKLAEITNTPFQSSNGLNMRIQTRPCLTLAYTLKKGSFLYRLVSFPVDKEITTNLFSIRSKKWSKNNRSYGRLNSPDAPMLYLSANPKTAYDEANLINDQLVYMAKFQVKKDILLKSIFVNEDPYTGKKLIQWEFSMQKNMRMIIFIIVLKEW